VTDPETQEIIDAFIFPILKPATPIFEEINLASKKDKQVACQSNQQDEKLPVL
jgi:hypothetical protein